MKTVKIVLAETDDGSARVSGEVKALDLPNGPTIAHCEVMLGSADAFLAAPGRHSFHFRVSLPCTLTLAAEIDGTAGQPEQFDATEITAGRRYHFEVHS